MVNGIRQVMFAANRTVELLLDLYRANVWEAVNRPLRGGACRIPSTALMTHHDQGDC
jgi:hypothetical protein